MTLGDESLPVVPARSKAEAVARLYAAAEATPEPLGPGSTEKKSVLVAIAGAVGAEVDPGLPKPQLAGQIAEHLGVVWDNRCWSRGSTITLVGLNRLLDGGSRRLAAMRAEREHLLAEQAQPALIDGFRPARSKLEAVVRMASLTGAPQETLGPGSKERKSVFSHLAVNLGLPVDVSASKHDLGGAMASALGVPWGVESMSAGQTITLIGLNSLLAGAERELRRRGISIDALADSPGREAARLLAVLAQRITRHWDGQLCVRQMREAESPNWRQVEWPGFYFEYVGVPALIDAFGGGPVTYANTRFDYSNASVWDLKVHSGSGGNNAILNAQDAFDACLGTGMGLGFLVLSGDAEFDEDGTFRHWHTGLDDRPSRQFVPNNPGRQRRRKRAFTPRRLDAFHLPTTSHLQQSLLEGTVKVHLQGRQPGGASRRSKFALNVPAARRSNLLVGDRLLAGT